MHDPHALHLLSRQDLLLLSYLRQQAALSPGSTCNSTSLLPAVQVLRRLKHASEAGKLPCNDADLTFIVRMLQVRCGLPNLHSGVAHNPHSMILSSLHTYKQLGPAHHWQHA